MAKMAVGKMGEFNTQSGTWSSYIERLEMYFKVNEVKGELHLPTLIALVGDQAYELLKNLSSPKKPAELTYKEAVDLMSQHLQPAPSALTERYRFRQRRQAVDENIATYVAELKRLAHHCKFGDKLNENLRDQFVCGIRSEIIRQRVFAEDDSLAFSEAVKIATSLEAAERDAAAVEVQVTNREGGAHGDATVNAISYGGRGAGRGAARRPRAAGARGSGGGGPATPGRQAERNTAMRGRTYQHQECEGCRATDHSYAACRFREYICSLCRRTGHLRRACPGRGGTGRGGPTQARVYYNEAEDGNEPDEEIQMEEFHHLCLNDYRAVSLPINIDGRTLDMEVDTGSAVSCINSEIFKQYFKNHELENSGLLLKFYNGSKIKPLGIIKPLVRYKSISKHLELFIIEGGTTPLLGRQWLAELGIGIPNFSSCHNVKSEQVQISQEINKLCCRYKELFSGGLGRYTGGQASLRLRDGAVPVFHRARPVPYALRERVDAELDAMLRDGIIEPVDCSDWASPLVPVNKADGSLRICADYKATVNPVLLIDRYPLPRINDLMVSLSGAQYFSKIDLSQAYNQIELDASKIYTVINTHRGLYRYNRLVYGLASSPGIFQRIMCNLLKNIPNVEIFLDDVIIGGKSKQEHLLALEAVFSRLHKHGLKLKTNKCVFLVDEIQYLGHILSKNGLKTDPSKIEAIMQIPRPTNSTELRSFLGIINFYGKFVRNMSEMLVPLYELLKKEKIWYWSDECEETFKMVKKLLSSTEVLVHYEPKKPLILTCDASARGVGGVLSQLSAGGGPERPVAYASRTLNDAEKNYSQIHREALAIIFCVNKFHQYLYGRHFTLRTDHKPLVSIFGPHTGIPTMVASRMQRWAIILSAYSFDIEYVRTDDNGADGLSRLPIQVKQETGSTPPEQTYLHFVQDALLLDHNEIRRQTFRDPLLAKVLCYIREGWPNQCEIANLKPFFNRQAELYEELGCLMWGHRLVPPEKCKDKILKMIHEPHMGIVKSKALARSYVWWPGVDEAVERMCRECTVCAAHSDAPPRHKPRMWPWPSRPWTRLHLDFLGPIAGITYLVIVDAMSKWIEVFREASTSAGGLVDRLSELFSRWGIPKQIVSDNGPQFASKEFKDFTSYNGIEHIFTAPYHPASNGLAENAVRTIKRVIKKAIQGNQNVNKSLWAFLMHYRNVEHSTTGESPAMLLLGRRIRTRLDTIKPDREQRVNRAQRKQKEAAAGVTREVKNGEEVWYRKYLKGDKWVPGQVVESLGSSNFRVVNREGETVHRHIDQLRRRVSGGRQSLATTTTTDRCTRFSADEMPGAQDSSPDRGRLEASPEAESSSNQETRQPSCSPSIVDLTDSAEESFCSPTAPSPQPRPIRQCRLNKVPRYKL